MQRWFVVHFGPSPVTIDILQREVEFAFSKLRAVTLNESAWNYLRGLYQNHPELTDTILTKTEEFLANAEGNIFAIGLVGEIK